MPRGAWLLPLLGLALAQGALAPLKDHPLRRQAEAGLRAARLALEAQAPLATLLVQGGYGRLGYGCTPEALCQALPETAGQLTLSLVLTPFPFGETEEALERGRIGLRRAELAYRKALTALQLQAVSAYGQHQLARFGVALGEKGVALAEKALEAAQRRGNPKEIREAELALKEAQHRLEEARRNLELSQKAAEGLVDLGAPLPPIPPPRGELPLGVEEARLALLEAGLAVRGAERALLPVLEGRLGYYPSGNDALSLGLSSKTLQPTLTYTRQDPPRPPTSLPGGSYTLRAELRLNLSLTLSPGVFAALEAARAQEAAAREALRAAELQAQIQGESLKAALEGAERAYRLAQARLEGARQTLEEARRREALGLESPFGVLQAELALLQAELGLLQAEYELKRKTLELYQFYGEILPEVME